MSKTVTQWFDGSVNPAHPGNYECALLVNGEYIPMAFPFHSYSPVTGWIGYEFLSDVYPWGKVAWRGLAEKPPEPVTTILDNGY